MKRPFPAGLLFLLFFGSFPGSAQQHAMSDSTKALLKRAARDIIESAQYCSLVTLDSEGHPLARMMDPLPPDSNFVIWLGTRAASRKVREIQQNASVCLYYSDRTVPGYVMIQGTAELVDDPVEKYKRWKEGWNYYYKDREKDYLLIKVIPSRLEVIHYKMGVNNDPLTWDVPSLRF